MTVGCQNGSSRQPGMFMTVGCQNVTSRQPGMFMTVGCQNGTSRQPGMFMTVGCQNGSSRQPGMFMTVGCQNVTSRQPGMFMTVGCQNVTSRQPGVFMTVGCQNVTSRQPGMFMTVGCQNVTSRQPGMFNHDCWVPEYYIQTGSNACVRVPRESNLSKKYGKWKTSTFVNSKPTKSPPLQAFFVSLWECNVVTLFVSTSFSGLLRGRRFAGGLFTAPQCLYASATGGN